MMKTIHTLIFFTGMLLCMACGEEDYPLYDTTQQDAVFIEHKNANEEIVDTLDYEFGFNIATEYKVMIPVRVMGLPADRERSFEVAPVAAETDMVENVHYSIEPTVIAANSVQGNIVVHLLRGNDATIQEKQFTLKLQLKNTEDFRPVGQTTFRLRFSDIHPERPDWWPATYVMPPYTYEIAQEFFKYFYMVEEVQPSTFKTMIDKYGDYFVKAQSLQGPFAMYSSFLAKFVLIPLREYYRVNDPEIYDVFPNPTLY